MMGQNGHEVEVIYELQNPKPLLTTWLLRSFRNVKEDILYISYVHAGLIPRPLTTSTILVDYSCKIAIEIKRCHFC